MTTKPTPERRYKRKLKVIEGVRRQGMAMLKRGVQQSKVAEKLGVSRQAVSMWNKALVSNTVQPWRGKSLGRPNRFDQARKIFLATSLRKGGLFFGFPTNQWSLERIVGLLNERYDDARYDKACVSRVLKEIGFTCEKPSTDDQRALRRWESMKWISTKGALIGSERVERFKDLTIEKHKRKKSAY